MLARRYAVALYELAEQGQIVDEIGEQLEHLSQQAAGSLALSLVVRAPIFSRQEQHGALKAVLGTAGFSDLLRRFVGVLIDNRRLAMLESVCEAFRSEVLCRSGRIEARLVLSRPLGDRTVQEILTRLRESLRQELVVKVEIDPEILGGMVLYVGTRVIDLSLKSRLVRLRKSLT